MGFRFSKRFKVLPGVSLNLSKSGLSASVGPKGAKVNINSQGRVRSTVGIPGTGISYTSQASATTRTESPDQLEAPPRSASTATAFIRAFISFFGWTMVAGMVSTVGWKMASTTAPPSWLMLASLVIGFLMARRRFRRERGD